MKAPRLLLFGASSPVGRALCDLIASKPFRDKMELFAPARSACDITNPAALRQAFIDTAPDLVINVAELSDIQTAESNETLAMQVNFHAPAQMAAHCSAHDILMIQLSTDLVFDGRKGADYTPDDRMNPLSTYGGSKMMGEEALRHELAWHVILRSAGVFSKVESPQNPLAILLEQMSKDEPLRLPADRIFAPTYAPDLAEAILSIARQLLEGKSDGYGTFHFCGAPTVSLHDFGCAVRDLYAIQTGRAPTLTAIMSSEIDTPLREPLRTALDCAKTKERYGLSQPDWHEGLREAMKAGIIGTS